MDKVDIYTTIQGDMWDGISYKVYGSDRYSKKLIKANISYANVVIFSRSEEHAGELTWPNLTCLLSRQRYFIR